MSHNSACYNFKYLHIYGIIADAQMVLYSNSASRILLHICVFPCTYFFLMYCGSLVGALKSQQGSEVISLKAREDSLITAYMLLVAPGESPMGGNCKYLYYHYLEIRGRTKNTFATIHEDQGENCTKCLQTSSDVRHP